MAERSLDERIRRLEDRAAIQELGILYGFVMDERDGTASVRSSARTRPCAPRTGSSRPTGSRRSSRPTSAGSPRSARPTTSATGVVILDDTDPDRATGLIASHAEVSRNGVAMQVALRYKDTYRRVDGRWRFADRLMSYMYYLPFTELSEGLGDRNSVRAYGDHRPSDWPEVLYAETGNAWLAPYYTSRG
ncbi:MAG: nuclear transport factor 2 family protein [Actinomycetales bacterium]|uniref:Nuclear transport factor 2 family protein n=1 Tax=Candidatus Phosphoribacter hodrii TaxID=2953743 RepID=A0A9D7TCR8_9MICO|nr:nuclear transport factor 2 family protein [Candidatus Phosphoribacter hodrii]